MNTRKYSDSPAECDQHFPRVMGRGRGRARLHRNDTGSGVQPGVTGCNCSLVKSNITAENQHETLRNLNVHMPTFPDLQADFKNKCNIQSDRNIRRLWSSEFQHQTFDKEESSRPNLERPRRSHFDPGVLSRIVSHLQQGRVERSDSYHSSPVDRKLKGPNVSDRFCQQSSLHFSSRASHSTLNSQDNDNLFSLSDLMHERHLVSADSYNETQQETNNTQGIASSSTSSVPSGKGRGRGRGRARSRPTEEVVIPCPGTAAQRIGEEPDESLQEDDRFADADNVFTHTDQVTKFQTGTDPSSSDPTDVPTVSEQTEDTSNTYPSKSIQKCKANGNGKALTLNIGIGETHGCGMAQASSPGLIDDVTQLISPNHVYVLDWAAAMETPQSDPESPLHWN